VFRLIDAILAGGGDVTAGEYEMVYFRGDDLLAAARPRGLPIGNLTSQFWANVYLNSFDHFVKRELHVAGYVRYVDDFVLFGGDAAGEVPVARLSASVLGWVNHARHGNTVGLRKAVLRRALASRPCA
jgi:hypothetical protein